MIKVFVSQPMNGLTDDEIYKNRMEILSHLPGGIENYEVLDTFITEDAPEGLSNPGLWYLGKSLEMMADADMVIFAKGFQNNRGCLVEELAAEKYGLTRYYL